MLSTCSVRVYGAPTVDILLTSLYNTRYVPVRCHGTQIVSLQRA
jgi:hypothetical protein